MPIEKEKGSSSWQIDDGMFETKQDKPWKTSLALDLNALLHHAKDHLSIRGAVIRVTRRVAEFEGIRRVGK